MQKIEIVEQVTEMNRAFFEYCEHEGVEVKNTDVDAYYIWLNSWAAARDFYTKNQG